MSIERLFDHHAEVWRITETVGDGAQLDRSPVAVEVPDGFNCAIVPPQLSLPIVGPAETSSGRVEFYLHKSIDLKDGDVLELTDGPDSPSEWRIVSVAHPRGHHVEAVGEPVPEDTVDS